MSHRIQILLTDQQYEFLDEEAISAFKEAQPFPNPPHQLIESNGLITFHFGFLYDLNGPPQMRWFKYND